MSATIIGKVMSASKKSFEVKWDTFSKDVYVSYAGWTFIGKAPYAGDAMRKAEAWLYNK